jgi:hypothetical protein
MAYTKQTIMVCVSAIAVIAAPMRQLQAAPTINCTRPISFGTFLPVCNGSITVRATAGSATVNNGCHSFVAGGVQPAICSVQTTLATALQDARITFTAPQLQFDNNTGAGQVTLDNYLIQTAGGSQANTHTFSAALLNPTHSFKVGGRLRFSLGEPKGSYSNTINIVVTSVP